MTDETSAASLAEKKACEERISKILQTSPTVRLFVSSLRRLGCPLNSSNAWRHLVCEDCSEGVEGGFDALHNQIIVCQNRCRSLDKVEEILTHELVHMFDFCTAKVDFANPKHLACTEVRAANLSPQCRFHPLNSRLSRGAHRECVRRRARLSVLSIQSEMSEAEAAEVVGEVFDRCYADLEPLGRRAHSRRCDRLGMAELDVAVRVREGMLLRRNDQASLEVGRKGLEEDSKSWWTKFKSFVTWT